MWTKFQTSWESINPFNSVKGSLIISSNWSNTILSTVFIERPILDFKWTDIKKSQYETFKNDKILAFTKSLIESNQTSFFRASKGFERIFFW